MANSSASLPNAVKGPVLLQKQWLNKIQLQGPDHVNMA